MPTKKHHVTLSEEQQKKVEIVARSYKHSDRERKRAKILLLADTHRAGGAEKDAHIEQQVGVCKATVEQVRRRFCEEGLDAALARKVQQRRKARVLDGEAEAFLIATVCSAPPEGYQRWSLSLLQGRLIARLCRQCEP